MGANEPIHSQPVRSPGMRALRRVSIGLMIAGVVLLVGVLSFVLARRPGPNRNALAVGDQAGVESVDVELQLLDELDFKSRSEILKLRGEAVARYPQLAAGAYRPSDAVFGQIVDGLPWWGTLGGAHYGKGERSIEGPSEQSRSVLNPFLLVVPEFYLLWDAPIVDKARAQGPAYPLYCHPYALRWFPSSARAEVSYSAACLEWNQAFFVSLLAYNARDWGLDHIFVSYSDSSNVTKADAPVAAYRNPQYLHQGNSCGYPGGCNNISPATPPIDQIQIAGWPAKIVVWLWRDAPGPALASPDMTFVIRFK